MGALFVAAPMYRRATPMAAWAEPTIRGWMGVSSRVAPIDLPTVGFPVLPTPMSTLTMGSSATNMGSTLRPTPSPRAAAPLPMPTRPSRDLPALVADVKRALVLSDEGLGRHVGAARKTVGRWIAGRSSPGSGAVEAMAALVHADHPALALELVRAHNARMNAARLPHLAVAEAPFAPPPPPTPPPGPRQADPHLVDAIVYAACDAVDATPKTMRPALRAAFERARALGLTSESVADALARQDGAGRTRDGR